MARRSADLVRIQTRKPEQVRLYGRAADEVLGDLATEFECRRKELAKRIYNMLKEAHSKGVDKGENKWLRSMRITVGLMEAAVAVRIARHGVRVVYPAMEKHAGKAIDGLRDLKYGKERRRNDPDEQMDV